MVIPGESEDEFVAYLEAAGIERRMVRRAYGYLMATKRIERPRYEAIIADPEEWHMGEEETAVLRRLLRLFDLLDQTGFSDLDPVGVQEMYGRLLITLLEIE